eukprot:CAMPEP_0178958842 /NCGR_PEP_ID=MMETSP0789-20121207/11890_1 /TAXON_ID=3005 /ORGANISM="Rhizosolenia setigera, Strain CCMP 1694" /LENGTH=591 /DNA_ID=CAMNT_0020641639 /DNA_START=155 /DNA_END=1930 /DNA_ORIENTATION=-
MAAGTLTNGGSGTSNGKSSIPSKVQLYTEERRLIQTNTSWTRIGTGSAIDARHSKSLAGESTSSSPEEEKQKVCALMCQLCEIFYKQGWQGGTGGGLSIRIGDGTTQRPWRVFSTPSGLQKEDMIGNDMFELDMDGKVICPPKTKNLKQSSMVPLWFLVYKLRPSANCVVHTHSMNSQLATLLCEDEDNKVLRLTHLEMLKGVGNHAYDDVLEIPIIENRRSEDLLAPQLEEAIKAYPKCNAVLVRRHGLYLWGDSWQQAKTQCESFEFLFETAIKMRSIGKDASMLPPAKAGKRKSDGIEEPQVEKRRKINGATAVQPAFNGVMAVDNDMDLTLEKRNMVPLVPKDCKIILLDIEGCTTAISFVKDVLFPYVLNNIDSYLKPLSDTDTSGFLEALKKDVDTMKDPDAKSKCDALLVETKDEKALVKGLVQIMVEHDIKATGLKSLQGKMWKSGYDTGELKGHVYEDYPVLLKWCKEQSVQVNIYSSGSIGAQKLLFSKSTVGDLTPYINGNFDTTSGGKKEAQSYRNIAESLGVKTSEICFVSDAEAELVAAREAGIGFVVMSVRPGNAPMTEVGYEFPRVFSLMQLCGC